MSGAVSPPAAGGGRRAAVLGHPIAHSLSPVLHRAAYDELGLDWRYEAVDIESAGLAAFMDRLGPEWVGLSLTMPLKETVLPLLDDVDNEAAAVRAVNTVLLDGGHRRGFNTDVTGLSGILAGLELPAGATAAVLGAGATARSAMAALGACGVGEVTVLARRAAAADELAALGVDRGMGVRRSSWPPTQADLAQSVVISTLPAGATAGWALPEAPGTLVDVIYHPWPTPLADAWALRAGHVVGGLELLARQAVEQVVLMTGRRPSLDRLRAAGAAVLERRSAPTRAGTSTDGPGSPRIAQAEQ